MKNPKVTVVMAVHNGQRYVRDAVDSILRQRLKEFEFIIVNDASTDKTKKILEGYADERIKLIHNTRKIFPSGARNIAFKHARGKYVAIMDSDDLSLPQRLGRQVEYLQAHPGIGVLGTGYENVWDDGSVTRPQNLPTDPGFIKWAFILGDSCIANPTVMMRRDIIRQLSGYSKGILKAGDYELWCRAIYLTRIANIKDVLLHKRFWQESITHKYPAAERTVVVDAMRCAIKKLLNQEVDKKTVSYLFFLGKWALSNNSQLNHSDKRVIAYAAQAVKGISLRNFQQLRIIADIIRKIYFQYLKTHQLTTKEKKQITLHAFVKFHILAVLARELSVPEEDITQYLRLGNT